MAKKAIIIGAGPAGLTAAYELLKRSDIIPIILEKSGDIGGISKTVNYKGNRIDIGGHRFFSKSDRVMNWWMNIMPVQSMEENELTLTYQHRSHTFKSEQCHLNDQADNQSEKVMLVRNRLSRIYFLRKFFTYPIQISLDTLKKLGLIRTISILLSYIRSRLLPIKKEKNLEDFFINRFGKTLYRLFFKDYTEKVWGVPCTKISTEWGAQRIKGISIAKAIAHAVKTMTARKKRAAGDLGQKDTETSLIEKFLYPKYGPGQLWEEVARQIREMGGVIYMNQEVRAIRAESNRLTSIESFDTRTDEVALYEGDFFFSTMPVQELIAGMGDMAPVTIQEIASGLQYRDFITVGILLQQMLPVENKAAGNETILPDTWIYIQERDVKVGRLQIFNNWSPYMVKDPDTVWIGLEYFCNKTDPFWNQSDESIQAMAIHELEKMGLARMEDVLDSTVLRMEKTYPAYFGTYPRFDKIRQFTDQFSNLFLVGRNGMHKYNNSDHSMLTAMVAVDNIMAGVTEKANIWSINTEQEYHEEKQRATSNQPSRTPSDLPAMRPAMPSTFRDYLLKDKTNRWYWITALIAVILQFIIFKHFYPYAGFIDGDSYVYLQTAFWNFPITTYPIGYPKFLRIFNTFTTSDTALIAFQYLFIQVTSLYLLFTVFYFYRPSRWVKFMLLGITVLNPIFLYMANYVSSDALFLGISMIWFTQLIWIIRKPSTTKFLSHALVLFLAFTIRYNALYYPVISIFAFALVRQNFWAKFAGTFCSILFIGAFILSTSNSYKELTGIKEFSPFSGWQIANNALYAYRYVKDRDTAQLPLHLRALDKQVRTYFDTTRDTHKHPLELMEASTIYMWDPSTPLQKYMAGQFRHDSSAGPIKRWATVAPLYAEYGSWLIRHYPRAFTQHYLLPNALKYYAPPVEFLETYNMGKDSIDQIARTWFHYSSNKVRYLTQDLKVRTLDPAPVVVGVVNVLFLFSLIGFLLVHGIRLYPAMKNILLICSLLWSINFSFSVFASPIALRFQVFPALVYLCLTLLMIDKIILIAFSSADKPYVVRESAA